MNETTETNDAITIEPPETEELRAALYVAKQAQWICQQIIEEGRPDAESFMELVTALQLLEDTISASTMLIDRMDLFDKRMDEMDELNKQYWEDNLPEIRVEGVKGEEHASEG